MQREILGQRSTLGDAKNQLRNMHTEIHECVQFIQDPQALKAAVKKIYQRHVSSDLVSSRGVEPDIATEYARQREVLDAYPNPNPGPNPSPSPNPNPLDDAGEGATLKDAQVAVLR